MNKHFAAFNCILILSFFVGCIQQTTGDSQAAKASQLYSEGKFAEAIPEYEKALEKHLSKQSRSIVLTSIGNCLNQLDRLDESLVYHDRSIQEDPTNHQAFVNKGVVYRLQGEFDQAEKMYLKALELAPDYAELHASMGALSVYQNDFDSAIKHLKHAIELDDSLPVAHSNLALAYASAGRFDDADKQLQAAVLRGYPKPEVIRERIENLRKAAGE